MYGLAISSQDSFGGGVFRGRKAPRDSVYDAVNALVNDERELFKRGGGAYKSTSDAPGPLLGIADVLSRFGQRTLMWGQGPGIYALDSSDVSPVTISHPTQTAQLLPFARAVPLGQVVAVPIDGPAYGFPGCLLWAGARKSPVTSGSRTVTNGSRTVTGAGTSWLTTADRGMLVFGGTPVAFGVVRSVDSDTQLTLVDPWAGPTATSSGVGAVNTFAEVRLTTFDPSALPTDPVYPASAGRRLLLASGARVYFSEPDAPLDFTSLTTGDQYHEIAGGGILGQQGIGSTSIVFTSSGVWAIANLDLDPFDGQGNIQHTVQQINQEVILWGDPGIAAWAGQLLVPALDDVYLFSTSAPPVPISGAVRPLYRAYVEAGYRPGTAAVRRGHYVLPIVDAGNALVDVLVCRLDLQDSRGNVAPAWTRWAGHAACGAVAVRSTGAVRVPRLLGVKGARVVDLSGCFTVPGAALDADGSAPAFTVVTQDLPTGGGPRGQLCKKLRVRYEMAGAAAVVTAAVARGAEGAAFTALTVPGDAPVSDGTVPATWKVDARAPALRFRLSSASATTKLILRGFEMHVRPSGKA